MCAKQGAAAISIDGYCGCLGGRVTVKQPAYQAMWYTGTVVKVGWESQNVGEGVAINMFNADGLHVVEAADFVSVAKDGTTPPKGFLAFLPTFYLPSSSPCW